MKFLIFLSLFSAPAFAATCVDCLKIESLEADMKKTPADPLDKASAKEQGDIADQASDLMNANLTDARMNVESAEPIVMMIWYTIPYDNSGNLIDLYQKQFKKVYHSKNGIMKKAISDLVAKGKLTQADRRSLLDDFGIAD